MDAKQRYYISHNKHYGISSRIFPTHTAGRATMNGAPRQAKALLPQWQSPSRRLSSRTLLVGSPPL